jgi:hypothetical protein
MAGDDQLSRTTRIPVIALMLLAGAVSAQAQRGTIRGTVRYSGSDTKSADCGKRVSGWLTSVE